ncbi:ribosome maturation factor RimM [Sphingomonas sp. CJ20]
MPANSPDRPKADRPVTLAAVIGAHGIAGEVRLKVFADDLARYASFNDGALTLKSVRGGSNGTIARFAEVADRNAAEALRGTALTVPRSALPPLGEGEYYHVDLLGLPAVSSEGEALGAVIAIDNYGAGDVLEIERPAGDDGKPGKRFMVPMRPEAVPEWDAERLVIDAAFVED